MDLTEYNRRNDEGIKVVKRNACLKTDLMRNPVIRERLTDTLFASQLYSALCNIKWFKTNLKSDDDVIDALKGKDNSWSCSFRYAAGLVADIRNDVIYGNDEDYMDWYCSGPAGLVSQEIEIILLAMNWKHQKWPE